MAANIEMSVPDLPEATAVMLDFLKIELDIATTFVESAKAESSRERRQWRCSQAKKAYHTVTQMMNRVTLSTDEADFLSNHLAALKTALRQLDELS
jgi:hypothetical protein